MDRTFEPLDYFFKYFSRRGRMQTVVTDEWVEDELSVRREGWVVVVLVN